MILLKHHPTGHFVCHDHLASDPLNRGESEQTKHSPLGIVAGGGGLVGELIAELEEKNHPYVVAAIKGEADDSLQHDSTEIFDWGEIGRILSYFHNHQCEKLLLLGHIHKRPNFLKVLGDPGTMKRLPKIVAAMRGGDDVLLQRVIALIEEEGFKVVGLPDIGSQLILEPGTFGFSKNIKHHQEDIARGKIVFKDLGLHDIGQSLVIDQGRVVAVEAAEGTDAMLQRVAELRATKRISDKVPSGVFLKASKHGQDRRVDLPTIGPKTIDLIAEAGLAGLVCEADAVIIAERRETLARLKKRGLFLICEEDFHNG